MLIFQTLVYRLLIRLIIQPVERAADTINPNSLVNVLTLSLVPCFHRASLKIESADQRDIIAILVIYIRECIDSIRLDPLSLS